MSDNFQLAAVRHRGIVDLVRDRGAMGVRELSSHFDVSEATIRRDLSLLDKKGLLARTHGGVVVNSTVTVDLPNDVRKTVSAEEKRRIGLTAIEMLTGNETVFLDAGTTALSIAINAHLRPQCTYVTTSLGIAKALRDQGISQFYTIGGVYQPVNDSFVGTLAISALRTLSFDIAFLCCSAIDISRKSISLGSEAYGQVQKEIIASSRKRFVVADYSKFKATAFVRTAGFEDLDGIISTRDLDDDTVARLRNEDMELVLA